MKNRSRNDLIASILGNISRGRATRTKIMVRSISILYTVGQIFVTIT